MLFVISLVSDGAAWDLFAGWNVEDMPDLSGKVAIVTGPTINGIGYESALALSRKGAHVILAGRSRSKGEAALAELQAKVPNASAEFMQLDLGSLSSVRDFATEFGSRSLHILMNNAGVMNNPYTLTADGLESQFATNHLGHYFLTTLLLPRLEASAPSRVVTTSSAAAFMPGLMAMAPEAILDSKPARDFERFGADYEASYHPVKAYARSKLANVLFAKALDRRLAGKQVYSNAVNPGGIQTNLFRHTKADLGSLLSAGMELFMSLVCFTPDRGAVTQLYLATALDIESQNIRGRYYQPQALHRGEPAMAQDEALQEKLWEASERLVAKYK